MRLGVDVGGTFTDIVLIDDQSGTIHYTKTLTTPKDLAQGVLTGIAKILGIAKAAMDQIEYIVHGTTIGTNALIERKGGRVGLITTAGFRDVLEIGRIERPDSGLYDMNVDLPEPLVPRYRRLEVEERIGAGGEIVKPLDEKSVRDTVNALKHFEVEAIAVSLLFSFRNPTHEQRIAQICKELLPGVPVTISSEVAPEFREFERTSTTVINAYLLPVTRRYLDALQERLMKDFGQARLRIMQASGGSMTAEVAKSHAVNMVNSGPAGGALATALFSGLAGSGGVIGVDMGGTSFDICLIIDGAPRIKAEGEFEGFPVKIPLMDVEGIGAGGGSIAWVDAGGALNVGPQSAGAEPGPACYGAGGTHPTVTDANLLLGRLNPDYFLGGEIALDRKAAHEAVQHGIAQPMGLSLEEAAAGIIRVVNANMVRGISVNSTQKGYDVREFSLLAFGGAGPLHAIELADDMGMDQVIIPPFCSVFSAFGAVTSDVRHDYVQTVALSQSEAKAPILQSIFDQLETRARKRLAEEKIPDAQFQLQRAADLRYEGQSYELTIPIAASSKLRGKDVEKVIKDFHEWHDHLYAYSEPGEPVEIINLRLTGIGNVPELHLSHRPVTKHATPKPKSERPVYFLGHGFLSSMVYERRDLASGQSCDGPCLVEETTSTTVIPPGWVATVDAYGNLIAVREN